MNVQVADLSDATLAEAAARLSPGKKLNVSACGVESVELSTLPDCIESLSIRGKEYLDVHITLDPACRIEQLSALNYRSVTLSGSTGDLPKTFGAYWCQKLPLPEPFNARRLEKLTATGHHDMSAAICTLAESPDLLEVSLDTPSMSAATLEVLLACPNLQTVRISGLSIPFSLFETWGDAFEDRILFGLPIDL